MDNNKLKIAFIGGGTDSAIGMSHLIGLHMDLNFEVVSGCFSTNQESNNASGMKYHIPPERIYSTLDKMLLKELNNIDAAVILTPIQLHRDHIEKCIAHNIPVICEKALTDSISSGKFINSLISQKQSFLAVVYNYLGYPIIRELKAMIENKELGNLTHALIEMPSEGYVRLTKDNKPITPQDWRLNDGNIPTLSLDLGTHLHSLIKYLTNEKPLKVVATSNSIGNFKGVIDNISGIVKYSNNFECSFWYSKSSLGYRNGLKVRLFGTNGSAEWHQESPEYLKITNVYGDIKTIDRGSPNIKIANNSSYTRFKAGHPIGYMEAFANYYNSIAAMLLQYKSNPYCIEDSNIYSVHTALEGLYLLDAFQKSSQKEKWVNITYS